jgi:hypothetical protein
MPSYVARIERDSGTLLERAEVTVEILTDREWRGRFLAPADTKVARGAELDLAFADGRHGRARVDHIHRRSSKTGVRLVELAGIGRLN